MLAGDLIRSMTVLAYKSLESAFEEIGRDSQPAWMTAVEIIDDDTFLGAENNFNLFTVQKDSSATNEEDRLRLTHMGQFHLGQMVNVFRKGFSPFLPFPLPVPALNAAGLPLSGSLVMEQVTGPDAAIPINGTPILYGTCEGGIGLICQVHFLISAQHLG